MKWITVNSYVDLSTGEITATQPKDITILKKDKKYFYVSTAKRLVEITNYYRRNTYKQPELFGRTNTKKTR